MTSPGRAARRDTGTKRAISRPCRVMVLVLPCSTSSSKRPRRVFASSAPIVVTCDSLVACESNRLAVYRIGKLVYTDQVTKRLIDVDDDALDAARAHLGTRTIKDTVNEALRRAGRERDAQLKRALALLADADLDDRAAAWR